MNQTQIFGSVQHSLVSVHDRLKPMVKRHGIKMAVADTELPKADLLLFPSFQVFKKFAPLLKKRRAVAVIMDTPLQLIEVKGIKLLDLQDRKPGLSYIFKPRTLEKEDLRKICKLAASENLRRLKLRTKEYNLIPKLLKTVVHGKFLDKFNSCIYSTTGVQNRNKIRLAVTGFLFNHGNVKKFSTQLVGFFRKGLGKEYAEKVVEYFNTKEGKNLLLACQHIKTKKAAKAEGKKQVPYKGVAKKFGVDVFELKYLQKLYRASLKEDDFKPTILHKVAEKNPKIKPLGKAEK